MTAAQAAAQGVTIKLWSITCSRHVSNSNMNGTSRMVPPAFSPLSTHLKKGKIGFNGKAVCIPGTFKGQPVFFSMTKVPECDENDGLKGARNPSYDLCHEKKYKNMGPTRVNFPDIEQISEKWTNKFNARGHQINVPTEDQCFSDRGRARTDSLEQDIEFEVNTSGIKMKVGSKGTTILETESEDSSSVSSTDYSSQESVGDSPYSDGTSDCSGDFTLDDDDTFILTINDWPYDGYENCEVARVFAQYYYSPRRD